MKKYIVFMVLLVSFGISAATSDCVVFAPSNEELESGVNKETICAEVKRVIELEMYNPFYFDIEVLSRDKFSMKLSVIVAGERFIKNFSGVFNWNPDGELFIID